MSLTVLRVNQASRINTNSRLLDFVNTYFINNYSAFIFNNTDPRR